MCHIWLHVEEKNKDQSRCLSLGQPTPHSTLTHITDALFFGYFLGPLIFATPGDKLRIIFKNKASRPYSMYAHGVRTRNFTVVPAKPGKTALGERRGPGLSCTTVGLRSFLAYECGPRRKDWLAGRKDLEDLGEELLLQVVSVSRWRPPWATP